MTQKNQPMPLEDLPEYLKSAKDGNAGGSNLVNTGQIMTNTSQTNWFSQFAIAALLFLVFGVGGMMTYSVMSTRNITVIVDIHQGADASEVIPRIVSEGGGEVLSVEQRGASTYEIEVKTRKSRSSFLEWLLKNRNVKTAELEE